VRWHKSRFGVGREAGSWFAERLRPVVATCRQQGRRLLDSLVAAGEAALGEVRRRICSPHHGRTERLPAAESNRLLIWGRQNGDFEHLTSGIQTDSGNCSYWNVHAQARCLLERRHALQGETAKPSDED
jgi:hypothetical protein